MSSLPNAIPSVVTHLRATDSTVRISVYIATLGVVLLVCTLALNATLPSPLRPLASLERFESEQPKLVGVDYERIYAVVTAYRRVLERPPTEHELQRMQHKLAYDPEFDVSTLERELRASDEFKRLTGMQKNSTFAEIDSVVSESSLRSKLADMYFRITGSQVDDVTMEFLYSRYRHTSLNDAYITALIQQMHRPSGGRPGSRPGSRPAGSGPEGGATANDASALAKRSANAPGGHDELTLPVSRELLAALGLTETDARENPGKVAARLEVLAAAGKAKSIDADKYRKTLCKLERQTMLDSIGYDEGAPIGSWAIPRDRNENLLDKARTNVPRAQEPMACTVSSDSSLHGTMLDATLGSDGNMNLY